MEMQINFLRMCRFTNKKPSEAPRRGPSFRRNRWSEYDVTCEPPTAQGNRRAAGADSAGVSRFRALALPSGMVDVRFFVRQQELGDRHDLIALAEQVVENIRQCLRRVLARVVEEHDGAVCHLPCHALGDLSSGDALPVERITIPYSSKPLRRSGLPSVDAFAQFRRVDLNYELLPLLWAYALLTGGSAL